MSSESMDSVDFVRGHYPIRLDFVQGVHGQCPDCPLSMDNVHWIHGHCPVWMVSLCPWTHWTLSRVSMDIVQTFHWVHGQCPLSPLTMSRHRIIVISTCKTCILNKDNVISILKYRYLCVIKRHLQLKCRYTCMYLYFKCRYFYFKYRYLWQSFRGVPMKYRYLFF